MMAGLLVICAFLLLPLFVSGGDLALQIEELNVLQFEVQLEAAKVLQPPLQPILLPIAAPAPAATGAGAGAAAAPSASFLVVGDWGQHAGYTGRFGRDQASVARGMARLAARRRVAFVVSTGDDFYPKGVKNLSDGQFETKWRAKYAVGALTELEWYNTLGDHDCYGNVSAIVAYANAPAPKNRFRMGGTHDDAAARYFAVHT